MQASAKHDVASFEDLLEELSGGNKSIQLNIGYEPDGVQVRLVDPDWVANDDDFYDLKCYYAT